MVVASGRLVASILRDRYCENTCTSKKIHNLFRVHNPFQHLSLEDVSLVQNEITLFQIYPYFHTYVLISTCDKCTAGINTSRVVDDDDDVHTMITKIF